MLGCNQTYIQPIANVVVTFSVSWVVTEWSLVSADFISAQFRGVRVPEWSQLGKSHRDGTSATTRRTLDAAAVESSSPPYCNIWFVRRLDA